jgi:acyl-coenzyme A synthetase/AMP-(fatty) acid ligase
MAIFFSTLWTELPRSAMGKVQKNALRTQFAGLYNIAQT